MAKIAINGFGRIGRLFFRQVYGELGRTTHGNPKLDIIAVNDLGDKENLLYLLKYDTVYGRFEKFDAGKIEFLQIREPRELPWGKLGIDIVVESTGAFESYEKAKVHLEAGAKRVVLTAPAKDADGEGRTVLMGVNEKDLEDVFLTSNGSCTTNATSPVIQIMNETVGIKKAVLNTVHGVTATQNLVDGPVRGGKDFRRGRAAAQNIVPSGTGAAIAVTRAIKDLEGKFDGIALRVPVINGSISDITFVAGRETTVQEINDIFRKAEREPRWRGILKTTEDQIVSSDVLGEPYGAIVDLNFTKVVDGDLVKILSWYDNEWGYVATLVKHVLGVASSM